MIAVDRYIFIVHSTTNQISINKAFLLSLMSLVMSVILSSPLFIFTQLYLEDHSLLSGMRGGAKATPSWSTHWHVFLLSTWGLVWWWRWHM